MFDYDKNLAEICGIHAGDGYLRKRGSKIELSISGGSDEKEYYDSFIIPLFSKFFELDIRGKFFNKGNYGFAKTSKKFKFLNEIGFPYGKKSSIVRVPKFILESKNTLLVAFFLRGFFDTDGHLGFRKCYGNYCNFKKSFHHYLFISLTTISEGLFWDLKFFLDFLQIRFCTFICSPKKINEKKSYRIVINGKERLDKWMNIVGTNNSSKLSRYLIWKKFGFCPTNLSFEQRQNILSGKINLIR